MPTVDNILVLAVAAGAMVLFVTEKLRVDLTALCVLVALLILGLLEPAHALYGFASPATATVAAMFVLSAGLVRTGAVDWLARQIDSIAGNTRTQLLLVLCLAIAGLSAFVVNTATVAIFIPVAVSLALARKIPSSRILIPLSFASQFGGVCTLIGTSTNILANSIAINNGLAGFGFFEFAPLGLVMVAIGIIYLVVVSGWLLPKRKGTIQQIDKYRLSDYLAEFQVKENSPLIGKIWREVVENREISLIKIIRNEEATWQPSRTKISGGDTLLVHGSAEQLLKLKDACRLQTQADVVICDQHLHSDEVLLVEALVPPRSTLVGRTLRNADFTRRFKCVVLALQRRGKSIRDPLADIHLEGGDSLLLQCDREDVKRLMKSSHLIVISEQTDLHLRKDRAMRACALVALVVLLAALNIIPILLAALLGAVGMVLTRCITIEEAYQSIDWKVIFLLGGILPLGFALEQTGTAGWLADSILKPLVSLGPIVVLAAIYLCTALLTETISNNAAAILLAPIAFSIAAGLGVNPRPFLVAITFAASTSFATPIGYQTNTMVYVPGGYRFFDFTRVGVPLNILFWIAAVVLIPLLWPF